METGRSRMIGLSWKSMIKRVLPLLCCMLLTVPCMAEGNAAVMLPENGLSVCGDFLYTIVNGEAVIAEYTGNAGNLTIPAALDGHPVTGIAGNAFINCISLYSLTIPEGVARIGNRAFSGCANLTTVVLPDSLQKISTNPFTDSWQLRNLIVSDHQPTLEVIDG